MKILLTLHGKILLTMNRKILLTAICKILITVPCKKVLDIYTFTKVSCLHFGQNSGKFVSVVSGLIRVRVLLLQIGHSSHLILSK